MRQQSFPIILSSPSVFLVSGDAKSEDTANKDAGEEKPEEDNDYHRSDEQVGFHSSQKPPHFA